MDKVGLVLRLAFVAFVAQSAHATVATETVERTFALAPVDGKRVVVVNNVSGTIHVVAGSGNDVSLTLVQTWRGRNESAVARAREAVVLEVNETAGELELVQGGAWRCRGDGDCARKSYDVDFDWTLSVPADVDLELENVNGGEISVKGTNGDVTAKHVNDEIELEDVSGKVDVHTVNGQINATFGSVPADPLTFGTVNGSIDVAFPKELNADLTFTSVNGDLYTDFPYTLSLPTTSDRNGGKHRFHGGRTTARIGQGGLALHCKTVNGNITIRSR